MTQNTTKQAPRNTAATRLDPQPKPNDSNDTATRSKRKNRTTKERKEMGVAILHGGGGRGRYLRMLEYVGRLIAQSLESTTATKVEGEGSPCISGSSPKKEPTDFLHTKEGFCSPPLSCAPRRLAFVISQTSSSPLSTTKNQSFRWPIPKTRDRGDAKSECKHATGRQRAREIVSVECEC